MKNPAIQEAETNDLSSPTQPGDNIRVEYLQHPAGEGTCHYQNEHTLSLSLAPRPVPLLQIQGGKTYTGMYQKGDMAITPANTPLFARWESEDRLLQIRLNSQFIQNVAQETLEQVPDRLELLPEFRTRNPQIEAIAMMLFNELQPDSANNRLYLDSLTNVLAVNLIRHHATSKPRLPIYEGGLPPRQLQQVLDYIDNHLESNIKLADLARLLEMSQFHFSRLFKRSLGTTPHQYLSQQRVERAKQLLKKTDRLIVDIAFECGFNSHSHLSKQFRQVTDVTLKAYRVS